ncbi:MAG: YncE family protein [Granulosicoccus sp.]
MDEPVVEIPGGSSQLGFTFTRGPMFGSGRIDRLSLTEGNIVTGSYPATESDYAIATDGNKLYQIGRFDIDSVTRFDPLDTSNFDYQISIIGDSENTTNPQNMVFLDDSKAYITRYEATSILTVDPSPETDEDFVLGEIDLSAYDVDFPNASDAIIVDDKLFVLLERINESNFAHDKVGYIAVFDTQTDEEIDTLQGFDGLRGIALSVTNPTALQYNDATGNIYVVGRGNFFENSAITTDFYSGGIEVIDPVTYMPTLLIDDGSEASNQGYFSDAEVVTAELGYLLTYQSFGMTTLRTFNPTTGVLDEEPVSGLTDVDITTLALGPNNNLWIGLNDATPGFLLLDTTTGELAQERVSTELIPNDIVFITVNNQ